MRGMMPPALVGANSQLDIRNRIESVQLDS